MFIVDKFEIRYEAGHNSGYGYAGFQKGLLVFTCKTRQDGCRALYLDYEGSNGDLLERELCTMGEVISTVTDPDIIGPYINALGLAARLCQELEQ